MNAEQTLFATPALPPDIEPDMRVGFILSPRFTLTPFAAFIDCLRHAADAAHFCRWFGSVYGETPSRIRSRRRQV